MNLETEPNPRFLNHEEPTAWLLTDLENGTVIQLSQTAKPKEYIYSVAHVVWLWVLDVKLNNNEIITETSYLKLTIKPHKLHYKCNNLQAQLFGTAEQPWNHNRNIIFKIHNQKP